MTTTETGAQRTDGPIHGYFGLTYANYQVLHRTLMQSMPLEWQERMVACLTELDSAFAGVETPEAFIVEAARESTYDDLTDSDMAALGVTRPDAADGDEEDDDDRPDVWYDRDSHEHQGGDRVLVPTGFDPVPHYNRGRTYIEPAVAEAEVDRQVGPTCRHCGLSIVPCPAHGEGRDGWIHLTGGGHKCAGRPTKAEPGDPKTED